MTGIRLLVLLALIPLVLFLTGPRSAEADPITTLTRAEDRRSPKQDMAIEFRDVPRKEDAHEVWLVDAKNPAQSKRLYSYRRRVGVLFSPNEEWLVVDDHLGSDQAEVFLFQHVSGLEYRQLAIDLDQVLWDYFFERMEAQRGLPPTPAYGMNHHYISSVRWSTASDAVLFELSGHTGHQLPWADSWFCVYDLRNKKATLDLNVLNRGGGSLGEEAVDSRAEDTTKTKSQVENAPQITGPVPAFKVDAPAK